MTSPVQAAAVQAPPAPPTPPAPVIAEVMPGATRALTTQDIRVLQSRRGELSNQLTSAVERRENLAQELAKTTDPVLREGVIERIKLLDARILQIEGDIASTGRVLAMNPRLAATAGTTVPARSPFLQQVIPLAGMGFTLLLLGPLVFALTRRIWRGRPAPIVHHDPESDRRLERIEQAVDAIAIEIERISEAQRFQTRLLGEGQGIPAYGFAQPRVAEGVERR